ncbi:MAG: hypothetical protein V5A76_05685, partial [Candidatus Thermoplasmatota archaeon]
MKLDMLQVTKTFYATVSIKHNVMEFDELEGEDLEDIAKKIQTMEIRGAAKIARAGALALKRVVEDYEGDDAEELRSKMERGAEILRSTRPTAVSLENAIDQVMIEEYEGADDLKNGISNRASNFIERSLEAKDKIAEYGGKRIAEGDVILTHCNSSMAIGAIKYSWDQGK